MWEESKEVITSDAEVIIDNEEELDDNGEWADDELTETVEEKVARIEDENRELIEKNKRLYQKTKQWYKKGNELKKAVDRDYVSKDDVKNIMLETQREIQQENSFIAKYEDANDFLPEIKKVMSEDKISLEKAYALVKGKMMYDEGYRNQMMQSRTWNHGSLTKQTTGSFRHIFEGKKK